MSLLRVRVICHGRERDRHRGRPAADGVQVDRARRLHIRVAKARGLRPATVRLPVAAHVQGRVLDFLGEKRVNVVELNAALADDR